MNGTVVEVSPNPYINVKTHCGGRNSAFSVKRPTKLVEQDLTDTLAGALPGSEQLLSECLTSWLESFSYVDKSSVSLITSKKSAEAHHYPYWLLALLLPAVIYMGIVWMAVFSVAMLGWWLLTRRTGHKTTSKHRKQTHNQSDTARWLDTLFKSWWTNLSPTLYTVVKENVEAQLKTSKPSAVRSVKLRRFVLGDVPVFRSVRIVKVVSLQTSAERSEIVVETEVCVESRDFRAVLRAQPWRWEKDLDVVLDNLQLTCVLRAAIVVSPPAAHVTLALTQPPLVWFTAHLHTTVLGLPIKLTSPLLDDWIHRRVVDQFLASLVCPANICVDLIQSSKA